MGKLPPTPLPNELTLKESDVPGTAYSVDPPLGNTPFSHSQVILLVHGYDNSVDAARASYNAFLENFSTWLTQNAPNRVDLKNIFGVCWPGDTHWGPFSFLSYPLEVKPAIDSARALHSYLSELAGPGGLAVDLFIIAHSLGNRLLLELLKNFVATGSGHIQLRYICMMAAAVPVAMADTGGDLQPAAKFTKTLNLYSTSDGVLEFAFPPGETLAGEGHFPEAIGRHGNPIGDWTDPVRMSSYGHHDYWKKPNTIPQVAKLFGIVLPNGILLSSIPSRELPDMAGPMPSTLATRALPVQPSFG